MRFSAAAVAAAAFVAGMAGSVEAQLDPSLVSGLSSGCASGLVGIVTSSNISSCLSLASAVGALTSSGSNSLVPGLNQYLSGSICGSGKTACTSSQLMAANQTLLQSCSSDLQSNDGSNIPALVYYFINNYSNLRQAACLQNSNSSQYCLVETLYTLQNTTMQPLTFSTLQSLLSSSDAQQQSLGALAGNKTAFCTPCNHGLYAALFQNTTNQQLSGAVGQTCGQDFLDGKLPSSVRSTADGNTTLTSSSSGTSSSSAPNGAAASFSVSAGSAAVFTSALAAVAAGLALL